MINRRKGQLILEKKQAKIILRVRRPAIDGQLIISPNFFKVFMILFIKNNFYV